MKLDDISKKYLPSAKIAEITIKSSLYKFETKKSKTIFNEDHLRYILF